MRAPQINLVLVALLSAGTLASASPPYEALGHLTYTRFDSSNQPIRKSVLIFRIQVYGSAWQIRTEPVIECSDGVGFYDVRRQENKVLLQTLALAQAYKLGDSPFQTLRALLKETDSADVFFTNPTAYLPAAYSNAFGIRQPIGPEAHETSTNSARNVAVTTVIKEGWPPADPSFSTIVWLAFTSPENAKSPFTNTLLQVWDDGNGTTSRFRQANWSAFPEAPQLISKATYFWPGKQVDPSGRVSDINLRDVADLTAPAATYHVSATTNIGHLTFPLQFLLTRYLANPPTGSGHTVSSTIAGSLFSVALLPDQHKSESLLPTPTFVTDYRASQGNAQSPPSTYILSAPTLPETIPPGRNPLTNSSTSDSAQRSAHYRAIRWVLALASLSSLLFFALIAARSRPKQK